MNVIRKSELAKDNLYMKMFVHFMRVGNIINRKVEILLKAFEITLVQFNILRILEVEHPEVMSVGEIKQQLFFPAPDVTRLLDRLEKRKLVKRKICPKNRRKIDVSITPSGLELVNSIIPIFNEKFNGYYADVITGDERDLLIDVFKRIKE